MFLLAKKAFISDVETGLSKTATSKSPSFSMPEMPSKELNNSVILAKSSGAFNSIVPKEFVSLQHYRHIILRHF